MGWLHLSYTTIGGELVLRYGNSRTREARQQIIRWEAIGIVFVVLIGSTLHFVYLLSGSWQPIAFIAPTNKSVWEHLKLAFWPGLLWAVFECKLIAGNPREFWAAKGYGLLVPIILIPLIFYSYTAVIGRNVLLLDIATFVVAVAASHIVSAQIISRGLQSRSLRAIGIAFLAFQFIAYASFTISPPDLGIFRDGRDGLRGLPPH